jgi:hypothetical protein
MTLRGYGNIISIQAKNLAPKRDSVRSVGTGLARFISIIKMLFLEIAQFIHEENY